MVWGVSSFIWGFPEDLTSEANGRAGCARVTLRLSGHIGVEGTGLVISDPARSYRIPSARFPSQATTRAVAVYAFSPQRQPNLEEGGCRHDVIRTPRHVRQWHGMIALDRHSDSCAI